MSSKVTTKDKIIISSVSAALFLLLALPQTFNLTNYVFGKLGLSTIKNGAPTITGLLLHAFVFGAIVYIMMK